MKFQPPKGTRDLLPEDATKFQKIIDVVRSTFEKYGFEPLFTPAFESFELLSAKGGLGEAVKDEIYYFKDKSDRELGLRFDLTMPLARVVTSNPQLPKPFKRYQIEPVWRYDNPQSMRWRQFWQADIDIVGSNSVLADAECITCICEVLDELGFREYFIRVNDRKVVDQMLKDLKVSDKINEIMRAIDKLDKFGKEKVKEELNNLGFDGIKILNLFSEKALEEKVYKEKAKDLFTFLEYVELFGIKKKVKLDLSLVRGLEYYTGLVFEVNLGGKASCGGGGRYDNLMKTVGSQDLPATGISLGLDRIFEVMKENKMFEPRKTDTKVFVANVNQEILAETIRITEKLRKEGISCQMNLTDRNLTKQLEYADSIGIPFVVIVGSEEVKKNKFKLRDMKNKKEIEINLEEIVKKTIALNF